MNIRRYLPSAQFVLIVLSFALSAGLVYGADRVTHRSAAPASVSVAPQGGAPSDASNWEATLYAIQAQNASSSLAGPSKNSVETLLQAAQSPNLTDTVARTLFINLSNAKSQGLGDDIPTQDQLVASAMAQATAKNAATLYTTADLTVVLDSDASLRAYGNAVMQIFADHPEASQHDTFVAIGYAVDNNDETQLQKLPAIQAGYEAVVQALAAVPVPKTLSPLHLSVVNDFARVAQSYADMQLLLSDPLRGLVGLQTYQSSLDELGRVFTNIAESLNKDGILFSKDEPGSAWSAFLAP